MNEQGTDKNARPIWQTRPCAPWCTSTHHDADGIGSRECSSIPEIIPMRLMETLLIRPYPDAEAALDELHVALEQGDREVAPRMTFYRSNGIGVELTIEEARELERRIHELIELTEQGSELSA